MQQNDKELLKLLANRIKTLRSARSKSMNKFVSERGFISTSTLNRVENGTGDVGFTKVVRIANALDITLSELFEGFDFKYEPDDD